MSEDTFVESEEDSESDSDCDSVDETECKTKSRKRPLSSEDHAEEVGESDIVKSAKVFEQSDLKRCYRCKKPKPRSVYCKNRATKDGLNNECNPCKKERQREWRAKRKNQVVNRSGSKVCSTCKETKPKTEYKITRTNRDLLASHCKMCEKKEHEKVRDHALKLRRELGPCDDCKETNVFLLQFDHRIPSEKSTNISRCLTIESIDLEVRKCVVRCVTCHRKKTITEDIKETPNKNRKHLITQKCAMKRHDYINNIKRKIGCCVHCRIKISAEKYSVSLFEFDHIERSTKCNEIGNMHASLSKIDAEIAKCQLLCAACHALKTAIDLHYYGDKYKEEILHSIKNREGANREKFL
jgi:hypothetical protein